MKKYLTFVNENKDLENESVRWYSKGKFTKDEEIDDVVNDDFMVGDLLEPGELYYFDDGGKGGIKEGDFTSHYGNKKTAKWKINREWNRKIVKVDYCVNVDGYTGEIVKLDGGRWPWYQTTNMKLRNSKNEAVRWYSKGKLVKDETWEDEPEPEFKVGDRVHFEKCIYWNDFGRGEFEKGKWEIHNQHNDTYIKEISYCENKDGYTGQVVKCGTMWPWVQTTYMELIN